MFSKMFSKFCAIYNTLFYFILPTFPNDRGVGLFVGLELVTDRERRTPATKTAAWVVKRYASTVQSATGH